MLGIERASSEFVDVFRFEQLSHVGIVYGVDFAYLVACSETVEEVQEGHLCFKSGQVRDKREVHGFLNAVGGEQRKARLTARHNVLMVSEYGQRVRGECACRNVENAGQHFAGDFVHIGNHEQKSLTCREGRCQSASDERAVHRSRGACLRLHFGYFDLLSEQVFSACRAPFVGDFRHGGRGRDRVDCGNVGKGVCHVAGGGIAVYCDFGHYMSSVKIFT